jgi:3-hydroxyacyl-CoA dehydrogenase
VADWVQTAQSAGIKSFYKTEGGKRYYYNPDVSGYTIVPGQEGQIRLANLAGTTQKVWGNAGASIYDLGDGVLNVEFHSKMNTLGSEVIEGINRGIALAEKDFAGLILGNQGPNFSAGANLGLVFMYSIEEDWDELDMMIRQFQNTVARVRFSSIPVVVAPHGLSLGGGCELTLHADAVVAAAETYIGLVEVGVGVIPGGGGTKEMALRVSDGLETGDPEINALSNVFMNIATAKVATSARQAFDMHIMRRGDVISMNKARQIADAKVKVLELAAAGYVQPAPRKDVRVLGKSALGTLYAGIEGMRAGNYISDHDKKVAQKLAYAICGGDLSYPQKVSEQYLLDLEREAFLSLCGEKKTLERIQAVLQTGRPLRN